MNLPVEGLSLSHEKLRRMPRELNWGRPKELHLGNLDAKRDWGHARDYVSAMWLMLQQDNPDDYVIATGEQHSVREFADVAFSDVSLDYRDYVSHSILNSSAPPMLKRYWVIPL